MLAPVVHILPLTTIRRERLLPVPGRVVVRAGQKVTANDVLAETTFGAKHLMLDISRGLGMSPDKADSLVVRKVGETVNEEDVIAGPVGLFQRTVRAPKDGRVVLVGGGQVMLELDSAPTELRAGISGTVAELIPDRGAVVETTGALIQGVWGNGRLDVGMLTLLADTPEHELTAGALDVSLRGTVVFAGHCAVREALQSAADLPLRGLILGSLASDLLPLAQEIRIPLLILEGFGRLPIDAAVFKLLSTNDKREVTLYAQRANPMTGTRPELVIPLPAAGQIPTPKEADQLAAGQTVRMTHAPFTAQVATLVSLRTENRTLPSGIRTPMGVVRLENGEEVTVPLKHLEILE